MSNTSHGKGRDDHRDLSPSLSNIKNSIDRLREQIADINLKAEPPTRNIEKRTLKTLIWYTVLTGILVVLTALLFLKASKSADLATVADSTAIKTLQETKREFDVRNRTFLQVTNVHYDTSMPDGVQIQFDILNNGLSPGYIDDIRTYFVKHDQFTSKLDESQDTNLFIAGSPGTVPRQQTVENIGGIKQAFENAKFWLELRGEILYHTYGDTSKFLYSFAFDIKPELRQNKYAIYIKSVKNEEHRSGYLPPFDPLSHVFDPN